MRISHGWAEDAISPERVKRWPIPGRLSRTPPISLGSLHYRSTRRRRHLTTRVAADNRSADFCKEIPVLENIFEETRRAGASGFLDRKRTSYTTPRDWIKKRLVEVVRLKHLVERRGGAISIKWIDFEPSRSAYAAHVYGDAQPLLRSDWLSTVGVRCLSARKRLPRRECMFDQLAAIASSSELTVASCRGRVIC